MPVALETFHHALGTVVAGDELAADHPIVLAVPHLFTHDAAPVHVPAVKHAPKAKK